MLRTLLLASACALAAPAMAQEVHDDMAPPITEGIAAPDAQDQTAPNLPPGTVPTGMDDTATEETVDHSAMGHSTAETGSTSVTTDATTTGTTGTMTTATGATDTEPTADATTPTTTAEAAPSTTTSSSTFTGTGGPIDIQSQWSSFDTVGDGLLSPMEFAGLMASSMGRPIGDMEDQAVVLLNESADELALVDTNGDWHVSQSELTAASPQ